ncbi:MAG: hypothetical protein R3F05_16485 [Planctomycetota bacterium]
MPVPVPDPAPPQHRHVLDELPFSILRVRQLLDEPGELGGVPAVDALDGLDLGEVAGVVGEGVVAVADAEEA